MGLFSANSPICFSRAVAYLLYLNIILYIKINSIVDLLQNLSLADQTLARLPATSIFTSEIITIIIYSYSS